MDLPVPDSLDDVILVTHQGCLDGSGCSVLFQLAGGKPENVRYVAAGTLERFVKHDPAFDSGRFLIFADVGLNTPKYADLLERRGNLVLLDHHKTSLHLLGRSWAEIEERNERCGTVMLRDYLDLPGQSFFLGKTTDDDWDYVCSLAETVDDFDRWARQNPVSEKLADLHVFYGQEEFVRRFASWSTRPRGSVLLTQSDEDLIRVIQRRKDELIERAMGKAIPYEMSLPGGSQVSLVCLVSSLEYTGVMLDRLLDRNPQAQAAVQIDLDRDKASLRTRRDDVDVAEIARHFRGGGHRPAAGHRLPSVLRHLIVERVYGEADDDL